MATEPDVNINGCLYQWKIENISHCWWLKKAEGIDSPTFTADGIEGTKWSLSLYPTGYTDRKTVAVILNREKDGKNAVEVCYKLMLLKTDQISKETVPQKSVFKEGDVRGCLKYEGQEKIFSTEKEQFLPEDTLTVQCTIWKPEKTSTKLKNLYSRTTLKTKRMYFIWRIQKICVLKSCLKKKVMNKFIHFDLVFSEYFDRLDMDLVSFDDGIKYISCNISIMDSEGKKEKCGNKKYFSNDLKKEKLPPILFDPEKFINNKSQYLPNGDLTLDFEFTFSTVEHFDYRNISFLEDEPYVTTNVETEKYRHIKCLSEDMKSMFNDGIFSDTEIRTSMQNFPAHKAILSARSPVFSRMFSNDMIETSSGHVDIMDFENDIVHKMLLYIYTNSLDDLQYESAFELYKIADKYQIQSLKKECSSFFILNLNPTNACTVLSLADQYDDEDFTQEVRDYILSQDCSFFQLNEWIDFMENNKDLALNLLYKRAFSKYG